MARESGLYAATGDVECKSEQLSELSKDFPGGVCEEPGVSKSRFVNSYLEIFSSMSALSTPWGGSHAKESGRKSKTAPQGDTERMGDSPALGRFRGWFWGVAGSRETGFGGSRKARQLIPMVGWVGGEGESAHCSVCCRYREFELDV